MHELAYSIVCIYFEIEYWTPSFIGILTTRHVKVLTGTTNSSVPTAFSRGASPRPSIRPFQIGVAECLAADAGWWECCAHVQRTRQQHGGIDCCRTALERTVRTHLSFQIIQNCFWSWCSSFFFLIIIIVSQSAVAQRCRWPCLDFLHLKLVLWFYYDYCYSKS